MKPAREDPQKKLAQNDSLKKLSDMDLLARPEKVRGTERTVQHMIVLYLEEVERRKLHMQRGEETRWITSGSSAPGTIS